jgi:sigma-B regulation protein RsbQ
MTALHLILLPGMDGTGELFAPLLAEWPPGLPVTVVRYPDRAAGYADHVAVARAELPRDRPYVLLGESFSGPIAIRLAAQAPANLRGLILCASFLTCPNPLLRALRALAPFATPKLLPDLVKHHSLLGRFSTPALRAAHSRALSHVSSRALTARLQAMADIDVRAELRELDLPALYLRGTRDRVIAARYGAEFAANARHGRLVDIDAPHLLLQAQPREAAALILDFLRQVGSPPTGAAAVPAQD